MCACQTLENAYAALQRRRDAVGEHLASVKKQLRACRPAHRRESLCTPGMWNTLIALQCIAGGDLRSCHAYVLSRETHEEAEWSALEKALRAWFRTVSVATRSRYSTAPVTAQQRFAVTAASKFLHGLRLHSWLEAHNMERSLAPSAAAVLSHADTSHGPPRVALRSCHTRRSRLQWLRRWRSFWGVRLGNFGARSHLRQADVQAKALHP